MLTNEAKPSRHLSIIQAAGALTLVLTMLCVSASAIGRHFGLPLPGTVEIVEVLILVTAAAGILSATLGSAHAAARLFIEHLSPATKNIIEAIGLFFGLVFCVAMTLGNTWILYDVWGTHEVSHLLGIPIVPFRILFILALGSTSAILFFQLIARKRSPNVKH